MEVCSKCHSFYTGQQKAAAARGRIDKFNRSTASGISEYERGRLRRKWRHFGSTFFSWKLCPVSKTHRFIVRERRRMKYSGIGGQAVIEGIMMKNGDQLRHRGAQAGRGDRGGEGHLRQHDGEGTAFGPAVCPRRVQLCGLHDSGHEDPDVFCQLF